MRLFMRNKISTITTLIAISLIAISGCENAMDDDSLSIRSFEDQVGTRFFPVKSLSFETPDIYEVPINYSAGGKAIWGAIGRDDQGKLYLGASTKSGKDSTAFLYQYDPSSSTFEPQGDVVGQLKRLGLYQPGMGQNKLHSKFYQADDGYIYFTSFDEQGEDTDINPTWGGHLWRKKSNDKDWQHLLATEEALIAVNLSGKYVYVLGYWDHVLYQFNTQNQQVNRVVVGSVSDHVSRNFVVDPLAHAYVPKVTTSPSNEIQTFLNEYDTELKLVGSYPMPSYKNRKMAGHHGIVGYTSMESGNILFTTSDGGLYEINVFSTSEDKLSYKGMMHPEGKAYIPSLFPLDGKNLVAGVGRAAGKKSYDWIIYELKSRYAATYKLNTDDLMLPRFYGTLTKDNDGNFYLVGRRKKSEAGAGPLLAVIPAQSLWPSP
jgi:hypothetical protein